MEIIEGARNKDIKAIYIMGENPVFNLPDSTYVRDALRSLEFMVVQDIFLSETARMADVVLPALGWSEKMGTYTNLERRIQLLRKAVHSVSGMEDWRIISELSSRMGYRMDYADEEEIMKEISRVSSLYRGLTYKDIEDGGCLWPYKAEPSVGETRDISSVPVESRDYRAGPYLSLDRVPFHSGTLSRRSSALRRISPEPLLKIGLHHAERLGLKDGDMVRVFTERGGLVVPISIDKSIEDERLFLGNNIEDKGVFSLMGYSLDPVTKAPGIEGCEVRIEKVQERE
jgi:predicted molibdopterin-dependent oxidoreductase YjgC